MFLELTQYLDFYNDLSIRKGWENSFLNFLIIKYPSSLVDVFFY